MKIRPVGHRLLVVVKSLEEVTQGGIVIPKTQEFNRQRYSQEEGTVIAMGSQCYKEVGDGAPWCKVGDKVFMNRHSGVFHTDEETGDIYRVVNDLDIMAVIEDEE